MPPVSSEPAIESDIQNPSLTSSRRSVRRAVSPGYVRRVPAAVPAESRAARALKSPTSAIVSPESPAFPETVSPEPVSPDALRRELDATRDALAHAQAALCRSQGALRAVQNLPLSMIPARHLPTHILACAGGFSEIRGGYADRALSSQAGN